MVCHRDSPRTCTLFLSCDDQIILTFNFKFFEKRYSPLLHQLIIHPDLIRRPIIGGRVLLQRKWFSNDYHQVITHHHHHHHSCQRIMITYYDVLMCHAIKNKHAETRKASFPRTDKHFAVRSVRANELCTHANAEFVPKLTHQKRPSLEVRPTGTSRWTHLFKASIYSSTTHHNKQFPKRVVYHFLALC